MLLENLLIHHPSRYPKGDWSADACIEDLFFKSADGTDLHGWLHAASEPTVTAILYLHGNGGNITTRRSLIKKLSCIPAHVFALDYRGYGRSSGYPSEAGLLADAWAAWERLTDKEGFASQQIIIFGESLGGAVAIALSCEVAPRGLIVQSSFTSMAALFHTKLAFLNEDLVRTGWRSIDKINKIAAPKLFLHGIEDRLIPWTMSGELFDVASEPKQLVLLQHTKHADMEQTGGERYIEAIRSFIQYC